MRFGAWRPRLIHGDRRLVDGAFGLSTLRVGGFVGWKSEALSTMRPLGGYGVDFVVACGGRRLVDGAFGLSTLRGVRGRRWVPGVVGWKSAAPSTIGPVGGVRGDFVGVVYVGLGLVCDQKDRVAEQGAEWG